MTNTEHTNATKAVLDFMSKCDLPPNEKIAVLKSAAAMMQHSLEAEALAHAFKQAFTN